MHLRSMLENWLNQKAHEKGEQFGHWLNQRRAEKHAAAADAALLRSFNLQGRTPEERFTELLQIAHERRLLTSIQHDERVEVLGFRSIDDDA